MNGTYGTSNISNGEIAGRVPCCPRPAVSQARPVRNCRATVLHSPSMSPATRTPRKPAAPAQASPSSTGRRLLLLDGHSLAYRAFFALPAENFPTGTGQTTNAVYGFTSMLINLLRDEQPTHVAVAFDVSRARRSAARRTRSTRPTARATPDEFRGQVELIKEVLGALRIPVIERGGLRGRRRHRHARHPGRAREGFEVLICTGDRDAFQLVTDDVTVLYPREGVSEMRRIDPGEVVEQVRR